MSPIEDGLAHIHKQVAQSGFAIAAMLARRKLNFTALNASRAQLQIAVDEFDKVLEQLTQDREE